MGKAYYDVGCYKEAIEFCATNITLYPHDPILIYFQAQCLLKLKLTNYALVLARYACELAPESTSAWVLLAKTYIALGNYKYVIDY